MATITFDALKYVAELEESGFTRKQAEVQAKTFREVLQNYDKSLAVDTASKSELQDVKHELQNTISDVKHELLKWMFGISIAQTALILAVLAFFK